LDHKPTKVRKGRAATRGKRLQVKRILTTNSYLDRKKKRTFDREVPRGVFPGRTREESLFTQPTKTGHPGGREGGDFRQYRKGPPSGVLRERKSPAGGIGGLKKKTSPDERDPKKKETIQNVRRSSRGEGQRRGWHPQKREVCQVTNSRLTKETVDSRGEGERSY